MIMVSIIHTIKQLSFPNTVPFTITRIANSEILFHDSLAIMKQRVPLFQAHSELKGELNEIKRREEDLREECKSETKKLRKEEREKVTLVVSPNLFYVY